MAKILVVDDSAGNRYLLSLRLGTGGHEVLEAADGVEALGIATAVVPDLVITDLLMPEMDGYELVRELRAVPSLSGTKVIFYTANYLLDEVRPLAAAVGVRHIVPKPAPAELLLLVDEALAGEPAPAVEVATGEFNREHLRALTAKLAGKIDELEAAQSALEGSEARFRCLAESAPIGIFALDDTGHISYSNAHLRQISGLPEHGDVPHAVFAQLLHPEDRDRVVRGFGTAFEQGIAHRARSRIIRPDGESRLVDIQATPVRNSDDRFTSVGTAEDVTEVVAAQRVHDELDGRLRSAERLESLGQLATGIAHDFNNMLGVILMNAQFVSDAIDAIALSGDASLQLPQMREDTAAVAKAAEGAADLTHQLLVFGRRDFVHTEVIDANDVVRDAQKLLSRTIGEHISLESRLDASLWPVTGDRSRLVQVVVNLVVNARDAIGAIGTVVIATDNVDLDEASAAGYPGAMPGPYSRISVTDNGAGMAPDIVARAFEPFFTTKPMGKGTGLGLATVYGIVQQLGGLVSIYSELGMGTTARVYLPAASSTPGPAPAPSVRAPSVGKGEVVVVVEDSDEMRTLTARILDDGGYSAVSVARGSAAVAMLEDPSQRIDLLLTDVIMPEMSGREVAARAAETRPRLPVLFMSGYAGDLVGPGPVRETPVEVIEKPYTHSALLATVAGALAGRGTDEPLL